MALAGDHNPGVMEEPTPRSDETRPREHLANERTLLAWARTAITFIALGFGVSRFDVFLRELRRPEGGVGASGAFSAAIGIVFVLAGLLTAAAGVTRYFQAREQIEEGRFEAQYWQLIVLAGMMCAVGVALMLYLVVDVARS
jgi:putative membrane protein